MLEAALDLRLQCVEAVVALVALLSKGAELRQRAGAGHGVEQIDGVLAEQMMALAAKVADLR